MFPPEGAAGDDAPKAGEQVEVWANFHAPVRRLQLRTGCFWLTHAQDEFRLVKRNSPGDKTQTMRG